MTRAAWGIEWYRRAMVDGYQTVGDRNPKWDELAIRSIDAMCRVWSDAPGQTGDEDQIVNVALSQAVLKDGCTDALVLYIRARNSLFFGADPQTSEREHAAGAEAMPRSGYHPLLKCAALLRAAQARAKALADEAAARKDERISGYIAAAQEFVPQIASEPDVPVEALSMLMDYCDAVSLALHHDRSVLSAPVYAQIEKLASDRSTVLAIKGEFNVKYAWDARGDGWASQVTAEGWKLYEQRLTRARQALTKAWEVDQTNWRAATLMIGVETGSGGKREAMELWYRRAMQANPNNLKACRNKLQFLLPRWHGDYPAMVKFGRELLAEGNFRGGPPQILLETHLQIASEMLGEQQLKQDGGNGAAAKPPRPDAQYLGSPDVWKDMQAVFEGFIREYPDSIYYRSLYAVYASRTGHPDIMAKQLAAMGGEYSWKVMSKEAYAALVAEAEAYNAAAAAP
jgi:hypothetical protein